ncbi:MAG: hypothetical protein L3J31_09310 [Bacteroidales bacterium]|nr:hypothetical protein [Bacteroidales bacterium]
MNLSHRNTQYRLKTLFWIFLVALLVFLAFNRHSKTGIFYYRSQIFADKAGYYVYLPATFIYHFDAKAFPEGVDTKTGNGFQLDRKNNKIITKYFYGVSLMQLPFFLSAHILAKPLGFDANGFSLIYHWAIDLAALFYLLLSFHLLYKILRQQFRERTALLTIVFLFAGTNLFYYSIQETGMSHVYSFFLFTAWMYHVYFWKKLNKQPGLFGFSSGIIAALIIFVRPLNLLFLLPGLFFNRDYIQRLRAQLKWPFLLPFLLAALLIASPQLAYWNYLSGSLITDSYPGESFSNWMHPRLTEFLFAPNNGLVLYNPIILFFFFGLVFMLRHKKENAWLFLSVILLLTYASAAWWSWHFGCGFAARNFVEYYALLSFPLAYLLQYPKPKKVRFLFYALLILFSMYNLKMVYSYGGCWFGEGHWDWAQYRHWILKWPA